MWRRFGDVPNYVEPFFGSGAVLLGRPTAPSREVINDLDGFVVNFWRAVKGDYAAVADYAAWPVSETDLHARHSWLVDSRDRLSERLKADPEFFDAKAAGWWAWGKCLWIGTGWGHRKVNQKPRDVACGFLAGGAGDIRDVMNTLERRLAGCRVMCGDWSRCVTPVETTQQGETAVFLDPPYSGEEDVYSSAASPVSTQAREWAIANGDNPLLRIAICGYEGEHDMPASWSVHAWKAVGGYGNQSETNENARRERIWFSPHCIRPEDDHPLFADDDDEPETEDHA